MGGARSCGRCDGKAWGRKRFHRPRDLASGWESKYGVITHLSRSRVVAVANNNLLLCILVAKPFSVDGVSLHPHPCPRRHMRRNGVKSSDPKEFSNIRIYILLSDPCWKIRDQTSLTGHQLCRTPLSHSVNPRINSHPQTRHRRTMNAPFLSLSTQGGTAFGVHRFGPARSRRWASYSSSAGTQLPITNDSRVSRRRDTSEDRLVRGGHDGSIRRKERTFLPVLGSL